MVVKKLDMAVEKLLLIVTRHSRQTDSHNLLEGLEIDCCKVTKLSLL